MRDIHPVFERIAGDKPAQDETDKLRASNALLRDRVEVLETAIKEIRDKVHARGELTKGLREVVRNACDTVLGRKLT